MRFALTLRPTADNQPLLQYPFMSWVYGRLKESDEEYAHFLHQNGYQVIFKHFTFSSFLYLHLCHRKLWLAHAILMEHTSDIVAEGKLIGDTSYPQRADKNQELEISAEVFTDKVFVTCTAKIDFFDAIRSVVY